MSKPQTKNSADNSSPADKAATPIPDLKTFVLFFAIVIVGVIADLWSKSAVFKWLLTQPDYEYTVIDGYLKLVMRLNTGAAFSIASGKTAMLVSVSVVALIVVMGIFIFGRIRHRLMQIALALFIAGICGNLYDRIFNNGCVRDFIDVVIPMINYPWPAFNVADSMLCTAVGLMFIYELVLNRHEGN